MEYLEAHEPGMDHLCRAAQLPVLGYPLATVCDPELIALRFCPKYDATLEEPKPLEKPARVMDLMYPYVGKFRGFARLLFCDAQLALSSKDGERLGRDLSAMIGLTRQVCDHNTDIADLVSVAITDMAINLLKQVLAENAAIIPEPRLRQVFAELETTPMNGRVRPRIDFERLAVLDFLQRAYSDDGAGDGHLTLQGVRELDKIASGDTPTHTLENLLNTNTIYASHFFAAAAKRKQVVAEFDRRADPARWYKPMWEWDTWPDEVPDHDSKEAREYKEKFAILGIQMPNLNRMSQWSERIIQRRDAARVAIAIELKRRESGHLPESLDALAPEFFSRVPPDRFTGTPLCYAVKDGKAVVYSQGPDVKDDHGQPCDEADDVTKWRPPRAPRAKDDPAPTGDWVLMEVK